MPINWQAWQGQDNPVSTTPVLCAQTTRPGGTNEVANLQMMFLRYQARTTAYAGFLHDQYPPFEFSTTAADPGGRPVRRRLHRAPSNSERRVLSWARLQWSAGSVLYLIVLE